ncbi:hypothetical protein BDZ45DRAFT_375454 [Acephala macrosclerotiorum]|nr:hypothetical protein BDZ45DRAFT_375454 [Acephala macrosclerotiorum]
MIRWYCHLFSWISCPSSVFSYDRCLLFPITEYVQVPSRQQGTAKRRGTKTLIIFKNNLISIPNVAIGLNRGVGSSPFRFGSRLVSSHTKSHCSPIYYERRASRPMSVMTS